MSSEHLDVRIHDNPDGAKGREEADAAALKAGEEVELSITDPRTGDDHTKVHAPAAGDAGGEGDGEAAERPDWCPEKFWDAEKGEVNVEALAKSNAELERQFTQQRQQKPDDKGGDTPAESGKDDAKPAEGAPKADDAGTQQAFNAAAEEFAEKGELTDETYSALEKAGVPREMVDTYIEAQKGKVEALRTAAYDVAGGEDTYKVMAEWAAGNLDESERTAVNTLLGSADPKVVARGAQMLRQAYEAENGSEAGQRIENDGTPSAGGGHFRSQAEMTKAMNDPRYRNDSAYRDEVEKKLTRSIERGIDLF